MNMHIKSIALFLVFASLTTMALGIIPIAMAGGPTTGNMLIRIYNDPTQEENSLATGDIDINDWPLSPSFINSHPTDPALTMNEYAEIGKMEFDINNQLWPTGPIVSPRTGQKNDFFNPAGVRDIAALHFRRALAHLTNKDKYVTEYLGGYGYILQTMVPIPALQGFTDYTTLTNATARGVTALKATAGATESKIYVYSVNCFSAGEQIVIGEPSINPAACEGKIISTIGADYFTLTTPLQIGHAVGEPVTRYDGRSLVTELNGPANKGAFTITVDSAAGFSASQWIRIGCYNSPIAEIKHVADAGGTTITLSTALQNDHPNPNNNEQVFRKDKDRGYLYEYDRDQAIGQLLDGGFYDFDGDGVREWSGDGGSTYEEFPHCEFWIRTDDPQRRQAGEDLFNEMTLYAGIPGTETEGAAGFMKHISERSTCFAQVMVYFNYNIYTGGWSMTADPDFLFDFAHSSMGQYSWCNNYAGFKNTEYDNASRRVKYPLSLGDVRYYAIQAQWLHAKYIPIIDLWAAKGVKAYRTGWENVVNYAGFGTDNGYSFSLMNWADGTGTSRNGPANTIVYGFKSDISSLSVITAEWLWDWNVLGLIYDALIGRNPYNLADEIGNLATSWSSTNNDPNWMGKTVCTFTLRTDALFHDGSPVKPADVAYSILCVKAAGSGNAWNYPTVMDVNKVEIQGQTIKVYFNVASAFAVHWAGFLPVINKDLWDDAIGVGTPAGYTGFIPDNTNDVYYPGTYTSAAAIRSYHPWESTAAGDPAKIDLQEDGGAAWSFVSYSFGNNVALSAFSQAYSTIEWPGASPITLANFIPKAFHGIGNVNYPGGYGVNAGWYTADKKINIDDMTKVITSAPSWAVNLPWGTGPFQYNPDCDIYYDGTVGALDLARVITNYGKKQG